MPVEGFIKVDCCGVVSAPRDIMTLLNISTSQDRNFNTYSFKLKLSQEPDTLRCLRIQRQNQVGLCYGSFYCLPPHSQGQPNYKLQWRKLKTIHSFCRWAGKWGSTPYLRKDHSFLQPHSRSVAFNHSLLRAIFKKAHIRALSPSKLQWKVHV